jgi:small neutral amino acid transporter SnatA (MarC family)
MIFITEKPYKKGEKWSWFAILVTGCILWGSLIGYKLVIGYFQLSLSSMTFIVGALLFIIGITIPAKEIIKKTN